MRIKPVTANKIERIMRYFFLFLAFTAVVGSVRYRYWETLLSAFLTFVLLLLPTIFSKRTKIFIPSSIQIIILLFVFASMYLGVVHNFFYCFWWWDIMLHSISAFVLGYIGFLLIYALNRDENIHFKLSPFFMALFTFCFASTVGILWEIFEFQIDSILGVNMQRARNLEQVFGVFDTRLGVTDTMRDLMVNTVGALIVSIIGNYYSKRKESSISLFTKLKDQFIKENPRLFPKNNKG